MDILFNSHESKLIGLSIFMAILVFQIAFVLVQWYFNKRADYLFYIAFMIVTGLFGLSLYQQHLTFSPFNQIPKKWFIYGNYMLSLLAALLYYRFARSFLDLSEKRPYLNKKVKILERGLIVYQAICFLFILDILPKNVWQSVFELSSVLTIIASAFIIVNFLRDSSILERYTMLAASFLVIGSILDVFLGLRQQVNLWIPCDPHLPLLICVFGEILTFTTGLTYKTRLLETSSLWAENELLLKQGEIQQSQNELLALKNNISRDLHDDMGARLSLINITLQQYSISNDSTLKTSLIDKCSLLINQTMSHLREMMFELQGTSNLSDGYANSTITLMKSIQNVSNINFHFNHFNLDKFSNPLLEYHLFRITQELINNTLKYAQAQNISIDASLENNSIIFHYSDDGIGFKSETFCIGNGIMNIQVRVKNLEGKIEMKTNVGEGFKCNISLPNKL